LRKLLSAYGFFKDYAVLAGGQVASKLLGFIAFAVLARIVEPIQYGQIEYVVGLAVFFAMIVEGGMRSVAVRRMAHDPGLAPALAFQVPAARLMIAVVVAPLMAGAAMLAMKSAAPAALVWLFAFSLLMAPFRQDWLLQATERMGHSAMLDIVRGAVFMLAIFLFVRTASDAWAVGVAEVLAVTATAAYCLSVQHLYITPVRIRGSWKDFRSLMREGAPSGTANVVWALNQSAPLFLIGGLMGDVHVAWFAAAARLVGSALTFSNLYHFNLFPAVTRATVGDKAELDRLMARSLRVVAWAGVFAALALTVLVYPVIRLAFGPKLMEAAPLLQIMAWTLPITLCSGHARWGLVAAGAQTKVLQSQIAGLVTIVILSVALGRLYGASGFALAAVAGTVVTWAVSHLAAVRRDGSAPSPLLALKPAILAAAIIVIIQHWSLGLWPSLAGLALFCAAAPIVDRKLIPDLAALGKVKLDTGPQAGKVEA
jgi:PST family polysaccharide transporter